MMAAAQAKVAYVSTHKNHGQKHASKRRLWVTHSHDKHVTPWKDMVHDIPRRLRQHGGSSVKIAPAATVCASVVASNMPSNMRFSVMLAGNSRN